jgi:molybdate transport system substrate-binding protein
LSELDLWETVEQRLAQTDNVRAALALVALGEAPLGVVYATDALAEPRVHIAGVFPSDSHPAIRYPAAVVAETDDPEASADFLVWLATDAAQTILAAHGFLPPGASE